MASDPDEMAVVYSTLMTVENLVEVKPAVVEMVCERTMLLKWLLGSRFCGDEFVLVGFWVLGFFFELNFLGFFVCLFLKKISRDEPKEYERSSEKNNERNKIF